MRYLKLIPVLAILFVLFTACDMTAAKDRQTAMNEYNDIIKEYNDLSRSITSFARHVHNLLGDDAKIELADEAFWKDYEKLALKVKSDIAVIESFEIKNEENRAIEDEFASLIELTREYLSLDVAIKESLIEAKELHKEQYDALLRLSGEITQEFDVIYGRLTGAKKE